MNQADLHNKLAGQIAGQIIMAPLNSGGTTVDVMILCESVVVGVALACIKLGGDEKVLDVMFERSRERLAELRLQGVTTAGNG